MNKTKRFNIRLTEKEDIIIRSKAERAGMNISDYIIHCCLRSHIFVIENIDELISQLKSVGNNLNRLTVLANMDKIKVAALYDTNKSLIEIYKALQRILEKR